MVLNKANPRTGLSARPVGCLLLREAGIYLFSQAVSSQLSSAQVSLTSVFGMGTGGSSPSSTPAIPDLRQLLFLRRHIPSKLNIELLSANEVSIENGVKPSTYLYTLAQWLTPLTHCAYQPCSLQGGLPDCLSGISYLKAGFTLRCFQRLSDPNIAAQLCHWRDNWFTRGSSIPVLSY